MEWYWGSWWVFKWYLGAGFVVMIAKMAMETYDFFKYPRNRREWWEYPAIAAVSLVLWWYVFWTGCQEWGRARQRRSNN